eukprot:762909-Hanusia_phi.AAC.1
MTRPLCPPCELESSWGLSPDPKPDALVETTWSPSSRRINSNCLVDLKHDDRSDAFQGAVQH